MAIVPRRPVGPYAGSVKVREPVARPLDVVAAELLLSASQAFLVGVLCYLAVGVWDERGVGFGPVAVIVAGLGVAIGAGWLYWLLGGVGWPLAAANVPTALFLGFALVLGWSGDDLFRVDGVPLLLGLAASVYGLVCGVFLDSPRRLRWDQRPRPRPGTPVPRVSPTARRVVAAVPRSVPRRGTVQSAEMAPARTGAPGPPGAFGVAAVTSAGAGEVVGDADLPPVTAIASPVTEAVVDDGADVSPGASVAEASGASGPSGPAGTAATGAPDTALGTRMPTERLEKMAAPAPSASAAPTTEPDEEPPAIELPTSIEPKAQKSPWAWAAPPEWTRDEDDEPPRRRSAKRS